MKNRYDYENEYELRRLRNENELLSSMVESLKKELAEAEKFYSEAIEEAYEAKAEYERATEEIKKGINKYEKSVQNIIKL